MSHCGCCNGFTFLVRNTLTQAFKTFYFVDSPPSYLPLPFASLDGNPVKYFFVTSVPNMSHCIRERLGPAVTSPGALWSKECGRWFPIKGYSMVWLPTDPPIPACTCLRPQHHHHHHPPTHALSPPPMTFLTLQQTMQKKKSGWVGWWVDGWGVSKLKVQGG